MSGDTPFVSWTAVCGRDIFLSVRPRLREAAVTEEASNEAIETARAVRATADATKEAIGAIEKTGGFLNKVFGEGLQDSIGIVADRIKFLRLQNYITLSENTAKRLRDRGYSEDDITKIVPLKVAIPLIENATLEEDCDIQTLWAELLANAMDPKVDIDVKVRHVSLLREMDPLDVKVLGACHAQMLAEEHQNEPLDKVFFKREKIAQDFGIPEKLIEASLLNLIRLSCVDPGFVPTSMSTHVDGRRVNYRIYLGTESFSMTLLGAELCRVAAGHVP